jgi:hypothetical protein
MAGPLGGGAGARERPPHPGDIDGGPPGSHGLRQLLLPRLSKTSMVGCNTRFLHHKIFTKLYCIRLHFLKF